MLRPVGRDREHHIVRGAWCLGAQVLHQSVEIDGVVPKLFVVGVSDVDRDQIVNFGVGIRCTMPGVVDEAEGALSFPADRRDVSFDWRRDDVPRAGSGKPPAVRGGLGAWARCPAAALL